MPQPTTAAHGLSVVDVRRYADSFILVLQFTESGSNHPFRVLVDATGADLLALADSVGAAVLDDDGFARPYDPPAKRRRFTVGNARAV